MAWVFDGTTRAESATRGETQLRLPRYNGHYFPLARSKAQPTILIGWPVCHVSGRQFMRGSNDYGIACFSLGETFPNQQTNRSLVSLYAYTDLCVQNSD